MLRPLTSTLALALCLAAATPGAARQWDRSWDLSGRDADALSAALALRSLHQHREEGGSLRSWAEDEGAAILDGRSLAYLRQRGDNHSAHLEQSGGGNAALVLQLGEGAVADLLQDGGDSTVTVQLGWDERRLGREALRRLLD